MKETLKKLLGAYGATGREENVAGVIAEMIRPYVDEMRIDALGNLIAVRHGEGKKLMFAAHMDHIGFVVTDIDEKGFLFLRGRKDSLIISGGENIYPEEVTNILVKMPGIAEVAVYGVPDDKWGEHVKASIVCKPGVTLTKEEVQSFCRENMPSYRMPREIEFLPELPKNATGKVLVSELKNR